MPTYETLSPALAERMKRERADNSFPPVAFDEAGIIRRDSTRDRTNAVRTACIRDIDKILHCPFYSRYADKTQVFSLYRNDDITHRSLHVQLVSRIARTIGRALNLNLDLIEAIALGHDIGHTPFGHAGERFLDELLSSHTGRHFSHNIHSVRVLDRIFPYNISLQTLCGIAGHDGELELSEYRPRPLTDFAAFDREMEECCLDKRKIRELIPSTLEGCVVRISDIIAYLGKDRQDAERTKLLSGEDFGTGAIGSINAELINNLMVNLIENSYGLPYIRMDERHFAALREAKAENYRLIYERESVREQTEQKIRPMFGRLYEKLLSDLLKGRTASPVFTHHIAYVTRAHYRREKPYEATEPNQLVVDYIASMTDDYFIDLSAHLFPGEETITYRGYFD